MRCACITHADCMRHAMGDRHPEAPARLAAIHDRLLFKGQDILRGDSGADLTQINKASIGRMA